jgi:FAD/FMN-containing dehydrogenase
MKIKAEALSRREALKVLGGGAAAVAVGAIVAGTAPAADPVAVRQLERSIGGTVVARDSRQFEATRRELTWNPRVPDRSPDLIVRAKSSADVASAVRFAREQRLRVAVRGSGHNYHAAFLRDRGILIDVGALKGLHVDAAGRRAAIEPGVKGGQLIAALAPLGLGFPVGHCPDVGLSGYLLGGGIGWNYGEWGPACMSVTGVELVLASGETVHADANHNPELFWAVRGAGRGFFAAVTRYDVTLYEAPRVVGSLMIDFELESVPIISQWVDQAIHSVHPSVEVITFLSPAGNGNPPLVSLAAFGMGKSAAEASERLGRLRQPPPAARLVGNIREDSSSFVDLMKSDGGFPSGKRMAGDMRFCTASMQEITAALKPFALSGSAAPSFLMCVLLGRKSLPPRQGEAAFQMTGPNYVGIYSFYDDDSADREQLNWVSSATRAIEPYAVGSYISEVNLSADAAVVHKCYSPATWQRLQALKAKYDPGNLFFGFA